MPGGTATSTGASSAGTMPSSVSDDGVGGKRAWHGAELGSLRVLDDHGAARLFHGAGAPGPVRARTGEDDRDEMFPEDPGAAQEQVHGRLGPSAFAALKTELGIRDAHVPVGRYHVDHAVFEVLVVNDGTDGELAVAREYLLKAALAVGVEVLGHDYGGREVRGKRRDQTRKSAYVTGRGSYDDEVRLFLGLRHHQLLLGRRFAVG
jgi:hypothetical protein